MVYHQKSPAELAEEAGTFAAAGEQVDEGSVKKSQETAVRRIELHAERVWGTEFGCLDVRYGRQG